MSPEDLRNDPRYKKFIVAIDKILISFDSISEWPDMINFQSRLAKTLTSFDSYSIIPHKTRIGKRLAQCLNPSLPSGVHQKTLETYLIILEIIGAKNLEADLLLYSYGLFPFLQHSSLSLKPMVFHIYETFFLPLGMGLAKCAKSFILAVIPVFDEDGTEYVQRAFTLLMGISNILGEHVLFQYIAVIINTSKKWKLATLNFLTKLLQTTSDNHIILAVNQDILVKALSTCFEEHQSLLTQRTALDLVQTYLLLKNTFLKTENISLLLRAAITVVLKKDISLNRRLYSWLLNDEEILGENIKLTLIQIYKDMFRTSSMDSKALYKPYKLLISLMDKVEIGHAIISYLIIPIFESLSQKQSDTGISSEVFSITSIINEQLLQSVSLFLDSVDLRLIWKSLLTEIHNSTDNKTCQNYLRMAQMYLSDLLGSKDDEAIRVHLPFIYLFLVDYLIAPKFELLEETVHSILSLIEIIHFMIPNENYLSTWPLIKFRGISNEDIKLESSSSSPHLSTLNSDSFVVSDILVEVFRGAILAMYVDTEEHLNEKLSDISIGRPVMIKIFQQLQTLVQLNNIFRVDNRKKLIGLLIKFQSIYPLDMNDKGHSELVARFLEMWKSETDFELFHMIHYFVFSLVSSFPEILLESDLFEVFLKLWAWFDSEHVDDAIECAWILIEKCSSKAVDQWICDMIIERGELNLLGISRMGALWVRSEEKFSSIPSFLRRPVMSILGCLSSSNQDEKSNACQWILTYLKAHSRIICFIYESVTMPAALMQTKNFTFDDKNIYYQEHSKFLNWSQICYYFSILHYLLKSQTIKILELEHSLQASIPEALLSSLNIDVSDLRNIDLILLITLNFIIIKASTKHLVQIQSFALDILHSLVYHFRMKNQTVCQTFQRLLLCTQIINIRENIIPNQTLILQTLNEFLKKKTYTDTGIDFVNLPNFSIPDNDNREVEELHSIMFRLTYGRGMSEIRISWNWYMKRYLSLSRSNEKTELIMADVLKLVSGQIMECKDEFKVKNDIALIEIVLDHCMSTRNEEDTIDAPNSVIFQITHIVLYAVISTYMNLKGGLLKAHILSFFARLFDRSQVFIIQSLVKVCFKGGKLDTKFFNCVYSLFEESGKIQKGKVLDILLPDLDMRIKKSLNHKKAPIMHQVVQTSELIEFMQLLVGRLSSNDIAPLLDQFTQVTKEAVNSLHCKNSTIQSLEYYDLSYEFSRISLCKSVMIRRGNQEGKSKELNDAYVKVLEASINSAYKLAFSEGIADGITHIFSLILDAITQQQCFNIMDYFYSTILDPPLDLLESERLVGVCGTLYQNLFLPIIKTKNGIGKIFYDKSVNCILAITKISNTSRIWKKDAWDHFLEPDFFSNTASNILKWRHIIHSVLQSEKERFLEILQRVSATPATTLFISRDQEVQSRVLTLRRVSFCLFCGPVDQLLPYLPGIQEKLVEIFKGHSRAIQIEAYLCLRVLYTRMSPKHLFNFWPSILNEMIMILNATDGTIDEELQYAVIKFIDILQTYNLEDFDLHQWMFLIQSENDGLTECQEMLSIENKKPLFTLKRANMPVRDMRLMLDRRSLDSEGAFEVDAISLESYFINEFKS